MRKIKKTLFTAIAAGVLASVMAISGLAANQIVYGAAAVSVPVLNLREGPGRDYEVLMRLEEDSTVIILERTNEEWYLVNAHGTTGFVSAEFIGAIQNYAVFEARGRIIGSTVNIRANPTTDSAAIGQRSTGSVLNIVGIRDGWFRVQFSGQVGYVRSDLIELTQVRTQSTATTLGQEIVEFAMGYLGSPYRFGGMSPVTGFDCSGFVSYVFRHFGITLNRSSAEQFRNDGVPVTREELMPGDLVFFSNNGGRSIGHVGIYIGNDEFIHSSTYRTGVIITSLSSPNRVRGFQGGRRVI